MILSHFILLCFALCARGMKLHHHMTKREIEQTFNCDHKLVHELEYEVAPIIHIDRLDSSKPMARSAHSTAHFKAFNRSISLYLSENDNLLLGNYTPLFLAERKSGRRARSSSDIPQISYSRMQFPTPDGMKLYHDLQNRAALSVFPDKQNRANMHGIIGNDFVVKPVPERVQREVLSRYPELYRSSFPYQSPSLFLDDPFFNDLPLGNTYEPTPHIIVKSSSVHVNSAYYDPVQKLWKHQSKSWHSGDKPSDDQEDLEELLLAHFQDQWNGASSRRTTTRTPSHWKSKTSKPLEPYPGHRDPPKSNRPSKRPHWTLDPNRFPTHRPRPSTTERPHWNVDLNRFTTRRPRPSTTEQLSVAKIQGAASDAQSDTVYPELLVAVDYETYEFHKHDLKELAKYMAAFWNGVDLRFRELSNPRVRLNIAGLIVPQTRDSAPYFQEARVSSEAVEAEKTLRQVGSYFANEHQFPKTMYDIAVAISHLDLGSFAPNGKFNDGTTGIAMIKGACQTDVGMAVALIRDKGGFNGITTAAHELAHSMGAPHDGDETADLPGGPCPWSDGYLMSYQRRDSRGMHWSRCSKLAMSNFFKSSQAQCMKNKPDVGTAYTKTLPGKLLSRSEQCTRSLGVGWISDKDKESDCAVLHCRKYFSAYKWMISNESRPPAEGSYCGPKAICLDAECARDPTVA